ncbi:MAG: M56 family metallopeptidase [Bacteroidales bacterium]
MGAPTDIASALLKALGHALLHSLWIGAIFWLLWKTGLQWMSGSASRRRYLWSAFLLGAFLCSFAFVFVSQVHRDASSRVGPLTVPLTHTTYLPRNGTLQAIPPVREAMALVYLCILPVFLLRPLRALRYQTGIRRSAAPCTGEWTLRFQQLCTQAGIRRSVNLLCSETLRSPVVFGILRPAVVVPVSIFLQWPVQLTDGILLHELYHLRRWDPLVHLIQLVTEALFFYHPLVWMLSNHMKKERELCCDDLVLNSSISPMHYARALYEVARLHTEAERYSPAAGGSDPYHLLHRIKRIAKPHPMKTKQKHLLPLGSLVALSLLFLLGMAGWAGTKGTMTQPVTGSDPEPESAIFLASPQPHWVAEPQYPGRDTLPPSVGIPPPAAEESEWEHLRSEVEEAHRKAMTELEQMDWESIRQEMETARQKAETELEQIDWEALRQEMEKARDKAMSELEQIDWESIRKEMEEARLKAQTELEQIDWESIRRELEEAREQIRMEFQSWQSDSLWLDMNFDFDFDTEMDLDIENP